MTAEKKIALGFDLGTTYSCVAFSHNGKSEVITNAAGRKTTPSVVAFVDKERIVGVQAFAQAESTPENVIYDSKRLIGRLYDEPTVKEDMSKWPFVVKKGPGGRPVIVCKTGDTKIEVSPEEVGATILRELKLSAESFLEIEEIRECCITCPASFNDTQRQATINAAKIAGLECLRLINEPTAAAIAYGVDKQKEGTVMIYDFGGGTFDATILSIKEGVYEVTGTCGDPHLGGKDLDNLMIDHIMEQFNSKKTANRVDIHDKNHHEAKKKLTKSVEEAKIALSTLPMTTVYIGSFVKVSQSGRYSDLRQTITRTNLEKMAKPLVEKTLNITSELLTYHKVKITDLDKVVMVGGFTKMPYVRDSLKKRFGDKVSLGVNPDEAVALGAAMMAEVLSGENPDGKGALPNLLLDVTPLALGIELENGIMSKIIQMNTPYPTKMEEKYSTSYDDQTAVNIEVYQGNREFVRDNKKLGFFKLEDIPKMKKGKPDITVTFLVCEDGVLSVTAVEKSTGTNKKLTISKNKVGGLNEDELKTMIEEAEMFAEEDRKKKEIILEKETLERLITENEDLLLAPGNEEFSSFLKETTDWLENDCEKEVKEIQEKGRKLKAFVQDLQ